MIPKTLTIAILLFCCACNQTPPKHQADQNENQEPKPEVSLHSAATLNGCYLMTVQKDSALLHLKSTSAIQGSLYYHHHEKDSNEGTIEGMVNGDLISAFYRFQSEGRTSVREILFKIKKDSLLEGTGVMTLKMDTLFYTNKSEVVFDEKHPFLKVDCK